MSHSHSDSTPPVAYEFAEYRLEPARRSLMRADGTALKVSGKAFDALVYLVRHVGEIVDRDALLRAVWQRRVVEDNNVNQAMVVLRRALGAGHIVTVAGRGYQFVTPVRAVALEHIGEPVASSSAEGAYGPQVPHEPGGESSAPATATAVAPPSRSSGRRRGFLWLWVVAAALGLAVPASLVLDPRRAAEAPARLGALASLTQITNYAGEETTPSLSPDGTRMAFSWDGESGNRGIYLMQIGTRARVRLTSSTEGFDHYPVWSPDGDQIAFLRQYDAARFDVFVIPSIGGKETKLASGERHWISVDGFPLLAWTPDCRELWFTTRLGGPGDEPSYGLHRLPVATGAIESVPLGGDERNYDTSPAISPDGAWLAFTRYRRGERLNQIMLQRLGPGYAPTGEPWAIDGLEPGIYHSLAWAPGTAALRFANGSQILEWPTNGDVRVVHTVSPGLSIGAVAMAPYGATTRAAVVTRRADTDIFALPLDPVTHAVVGPATPRVRTTSVEYHPRISPDGKRLAFVSDRSGRRALWVADIDGTNERQLTDLGELITGFPRWSPDSSRIAFHTSARNESRVIYTVDVAEGPARRLINGCCPGGWSADGEYLYVHNFDRLARVLRVNVATGRHETLFVGELAIESVDGRFLLYAKSSERGYFRRSLEGDPVTSSEERLVDDYTPANGGLVPVADGFFYVGFGRDDRPRAFRFFDYALGKARDIETAPANVAIGLTVSPDGRELLYAAANGEPAADIALLEFSQAEAD